MADAEQPKKEDETTKSQEDDEEEAGSKITITVKTPKEKETFEVYEKKTVKDFKEQVAPHFKAEPDQLVMIYAGKIMKDSDTLQSHNVKEGFTIHLVIRAAAKQSESGPSRPPADISATPYNLGGLGGLPGMEGLGMGSNSFMELQNRMQTEILGNPELLRQVRFRDCAKELARNAYGITKCLVESAAGTLLQP